MVRYQPNSGNAGEYPGHPRQPHPPANRWSSSLEGDAAVRLRRCAQPLPGTKNLWVKGPRPLRVEPLELEVAEPLPDICPEHGQTAVSRRPMEMRFYDTEKHPRSPHLMPGPVFKDMSRPKGQMPSPLSTIVVGDWPVCEQCLAVSRRYLRVSTLLFISLGVAALAGVVTLWVVPVFTDFDPKAGPYPMVFGLGCILLPLLALLVLLIGAKGGEWVTYRSLDDEQFLSIKAQPSFRAALEQQRRFHKPPHQGGT